MSNEGKHGSRATDSEERRDDMHSERARPRQPVHEWRLLGRKRCPGYGVFAVLGAQPRTQRLRQTDHSHAERTVVGSGFLGMSGNPAALTEFRGRYAQLPAVGLPRTPNLTSNSLHSEQQDKYAQFALE